MPLLRTLGRLTLERDDGADAGGRRMILALLTWLARQRHRAANRERLVTIFWERQDTGAGRHSLRQALSECRALLPGGLLDSNPDQVALAPGALDLDADRFVELVARKDWGAAVAAYGGEFLPGLDDLGGEEWRTWIEGERADLRRQADAAFAAAVMEAGAEADWVGSTTLAEQWAAIAPGDDRPIIALARALLAGNRPAEAAGRLAGHLERLRLEGREAGSELQRLSATIGAPVARSPARGLLTPDLVGRQEPFGRLTDAWQAVAAGGAGTLLVVEADEGLGKSRLLTEFARWVRSQPRSGVIVEARSAEGDAAHPWRGLAGVLDQLASAPGLTAAPGEDLVTLAELSPRLRHRFAGHTASIHGEVGKAAVRVLAEVTHEQPTLLLLDDADRLDSPSAVALTELACHLPDRLLLVLSGRPGHLADGPFGPLLREAGGAARTLHLRALDVPAAVEMVASMGPMDPAAASAIGEAAIGDLGGSPSTIILLVTDLADRGLLSPSPTGRLELTRPLGRPLPLPDTLRERWTRQTRQLAPPARALVHLVAAAGHPASLDSLARASKLHPEALEESIGHLLSARIIRRAPGDGVAYECATGDLRRAVLETLPPRRQTELQAALADHSAGNPSRRRRAAVAGALMLVTIIVALWRWWGPGLPEGELSVLVTDVQTRMPDDGDLARPLFLAALTELQEVSSVRPAPRSLVRDAVTRMGRPGADSLVDEALALEVAAREGIELVVVLEVDRTAAGRELSYRLLTGATGDLIAGGAVRADTDADVLPAANRLLRDLRSALGGAGATVGDAEGYPRVSTHSLEALRHYTNGSQAWANREYGRAKASWHEAVALDSGFALAWAALAGEAFRVQFEQGGRDYLARARAHAVRLSPRERLQLGAIEARWLGTSAEALHAAREMATRYPDRDAWYNLGSTLMRQQRCTEAIPALRRAVDLDPGMANAHINIATCFQFLQQYDSAVVSYQRAGTMDSTVLRLGNVGVEYGMALRMRGEDEAAEQHYATMSGWGLDWNRGLATRQRAWMAMSRGQYRSAASLAGRAAEMQQAGNVPQGAFRDRMLRARALLRAGSPQAATELREAWRLRPDDLLSLALLWPVVELAREAGLPVEAQAIRQRALELARSGVVTDEPLVAALQATAALDRGDVAGALDRIAEAWPRPAEVRWGYLDLVRAQALERAGQRDSALAQWQRIAESRWVGWEIEDHWSQADLAVARLMAELGRTAESVAALNRLLARWQDGDPDAPALVAARQLQRRVLAEVGDGAPPEGGGRL